MDINLFVNNLKEMKLQRNYSLCLNMFLALTLVITLLIVLKRSNLHTTIVVPATLGGAVEITESGVDEAYLTQWTEFLTALKLNVTPAIVNKQQNTLLSYIEPGKYGEIKAHLTQEQESIQKNDMSTAFYPQITQVVDKKNLVTKISGLLRVYIGNEVNQEVQASYELQFKFIGGRLLLNSFKEVSRV
ncbi:MAG: type IV conjugative transfer system protein TraE [Rickettsiaceae bacterium]|nr:type IV conjugative transfer system protein TraE [Rickettsiaceae bacterium]